MAQQVELLPEYYGVLWPYVKDEDISDIDCNGQQIWVTHNANGRYLVKESLSKEFVAAFCQKIATLQRKNFNPMNPLLEAETANLRISILHESVSVGGRSISIRKSLPKQRFDLEGAVQQGYASKEILEFLTRCVKSHFTFVICGEPGSGKTECAKFLACQIPKKERIITVEDNLEWHLKKIQEDADVVELKVYSEDGEGIFSYRDAIKASLRQNPKWLMLSEARGKEAKQLMEAWSTGICGITTLHTDDTRKIPERILNMIGEYTDANRLENQIYNDIDIGILLAFAIDDHGRLYRRIEQVCLFARVNGENMEYMFVENGERTTESIPDVFTRKLLNV